MGPLSGTDGISPKASEAATKHPEIRRLALGQLCSGRDAHQGKFRPPLKRVWNLTIARINRVLLPWGDSPSVRPAERLPSFYECPGRSKQGALSERADVRDYLEYIIAAALEKLGPFISAYARVFPILSHN